MCDFHSVIVTGDGRILHDPSNSHSAIANAHGLPPGLDAKWWECEWDGKGEMPVRLVQSRGKETAPTQAAYSAAEAHYRKLQAVLSGAASCEDTSPFNLPEYEDVRGTCRCAAAMRRVENMLKELAASLDKVPVREQIRFVREFTERLDLDMADVADEEIEAAVESATEDLYSSDSVEHLTAEAVEQAKAEWEEEAEQAKQEAYRKGFTDCLNGMAAKPDFVNGLPSFLFV